MPELPEVETIARQLRARGVEGKEIRSVNVNWARTVEPLSVTRFSQELCETSINEVSRYGKWLMLRLSSGKTVMIHLRMSGSFWMTPTSHTCVVLELSGGVKLYYRDTRKFGRWRLVNNPSEVLDALGPDALTKAFSLKYFSGMLSNRRRMIKPLLLDQSMVAGLGNIYVDEALWEAKIHPERLSDSLKAYELELLFKAIKHVLKTGVRNRGTSLGEGKTNYRDLEGESGGHRDKVKAYGRDGKACERCKTNLKKMKIAQRGTTFCPACQVI